jgi:HAE1 family hydrophobic/amphiphilic exporter-1
MWFTRLAIARPILIWMSLFAIAALGLRAYSLLPAELNPRVELSTLVITTFYPGAGPPTIEAQVTKPLEDAIGTVPGVKTISSRSQANVSIISAEFRVGIDLDEVAAEVRGRAEALRASLPSEVRPPIVAKLDINALPVLQLGFYSETRSLQQLRALVDNTVRPALERIPGVAGVQVIGGKRREIQVEVENGKLAQYGLTMADVVNSLKAAGRDVPGGGIAQGRTQTDIRLSGAFTSLDAIRATQILAPHLMQQQAMQRMQAPNALTAPPLVLDDVADVRDGFAEQEEINRINLREGVSLLFSKASDANTVQVVEEIVRALPSLELPSDVTYVKMRDDSVMVRSALEDVNMTLLLGAVLAMIVILLFLHNLRGTFIVSLAIPSCIVATFLVIWAAGFTLNQMTLLALSLSVGILVDDSIVVLESITRHLKNGESPREAALNGRSEIGFADVTTTLVDVVVFVPIAFMGGIVGGFFKEFGLTIATATLLSLVVSFSVTPMLAARWYKSGEEIEAQRGLFLLFERLYRSLERLYALLIHQALRRRFLVLFGGALSLAGIFLLSATQLGTEFMPGTDLGLISIAVEMPPGSSLAATDEVARRIEAQVAAIPEVETGASNVGQIVGGFGSIPQQGAQFAQINLFLRDKRTLLDRLTGGGKETRRNRSDEEIAGLLRTQLQSLAEERRGKIRVSAVRSVVGIATPIQLDLLGNDMAQLTQYAEAVRDKIKAIPGVLDPDVSVRSGKPELQAQVDRQRAAQFGIPVAQAGAIVRDSITGNTETVFRQGGQEFPVRVRLKASDRARAAEAQNIVVGSDTSGQPVLLADIATLVRRTGPSSIERRDGQRMVALSAGLAPGYALNNVMQQIYQVIATMPQEGVTLKEAGDSQILAENIPYFVTSLGLATLLVYIVMASLFNSLGTPFVIMFTLPMALIGALGALVLTGNSLSLVSGIGVLMLIGLMGRNAILLLDYTNTLRARGAERNAALAEAGATRLRPILMTTTATVAGMSPVALRIGEAAEVRAPMAVVVIGGLLVSTVLTLVVIPVLYSLFDDWSGGKRRQEAPEPARVPARFALRPPSRNEKDTGI